MIGIVPKPQTQRVCAILRRSLNVVLLGCLFILLASLLHSWYAGNAVADRWQVAISYVMHGPKVLVASILLLLGGLLLIWIGSGFFAAAAAALVYFFVLSPLTLLLLGVLKFVPPATQRTQESVRLEHQIESLTADTPQEQLLRMQTVWAMQSSYFHSKKTDPNNPDSYYVYSALKACHPDRPESQLRDLAGKCGSLEDAIAEAVRLEQGDSMAEKLKVAIYSQPVCPNCGEHRALNASICYGCLFGRRE
jgi:hypothetical protein